jgi:hypothetical protein
VEDHVTVTFRFGVGQEVKVWAGLRTMFGDDYPDRGVVRQHLPGYPTGPAYEVVFPEGSNPPYACLKPEWVFPA